MHNRIYLLIIWKSTVSWKTRGLTPLLKIEFTTAEVDFVILLDDFKLASGWVFS